MDSRADKAAVRLQLVGGLGNQVFGYMFGRYLTQKGIQIIYDTSEIDRGYTKHGVFLESLDFEGRFVNFREKNGLVVYYLRRLSYALQARFPDIPWPRFLAPCYSASEVGWDVQHELNAAPGMTLRGYFASYRYFAEVAAVEDDILAIVPRSPSNFYRDQYAELSKLRFLAVHVRRGDYVGLSGLYGLCGRDYFRDAITKASEIAGPWEKIVVFSDDIKESKSLFSEFGDLDVKFIEPVSESGAEESLMLMTLATGHVISNSSFSLWGSLLSKTSLITVRPEPWHKGMDTPLDLFPKSWLESPSHFLGN